MKGYHLISLPEKQGAMLSYVSARLGGAGHLLA